jgi:hypothetical protein
VAPTPDGFAGPRARRLDTAALVLKNHLLCLLSRPRGSALPARAAVRLFCTWELTPKEYDSWARAPVSETGLLFLAAEMKRRATVDGGSLFGRARRFAFSAPGVQCTIRMTCRPGPPCHILGRLGIRCASVGISCSISGRERESLP